MVVIQKGKTVKVDVMTGNQGDNVVEVVGALQAGEQVIVNADDEFKQGLTIK